MKAKIFATVVFVLLVISSSYPQIKLSDWLHVPLTDMIIGGGTLTVGGYYYNEYDRYNQKNGTWFELYEILPDSTSRYLYLKVSNYSNGKLNGFQMDLFSPKRFGSFWDIDVIRSLEFNPDTIKNRKWRLQRMSLYEEDSVIFKMGIEGYLPHYILYDKTEKDIIIPPDTLWEEEGWINGEYVGEKDKDIEYIESIGYEGYIGIDSTLNERYTEQYRYIGFGLNGNFILRGAGFLRKHPTLKEYLEQYGVPLTM